MLQGTHSIHVCFTYLDPKDEALQQSKIYYQHRLSMMQNGEYFVDDEEEDNGDKEESPEESNKPEQKEEFMLYYEKLCRGESNKVIRHGR